MERPSIRAYPPAQVIAEKFQTMVALGLANGRMKDFYDLWAIPKAMPIDDQALNTAIAATFERRTTPIPKERPRSEEHTSELQSLMRISYAVFCLKKKNKTTTHI